MSHHSGSAWYGTFGTVVISGDQRSFTDNSSVGMIDSSAGADPEQSFIKGLGNATFELSYVCNGIEGAAMRQALAHGSYGTLTHGPEGTATGQPKYSCVVWITAHNHENPYDNVAVGSVSFQKTGAWLAHYEKNVSGTW